MKRRTWQEIGRKGWKEENERKKEKREKEKCIDRNLRERERVKGQLGII